MKMKMYIQTEPFFKISHLFKAYELYVLLSKRQKNNITVGKYQSRHLIPKARRQPPANPQMSKVKTKKICKEYGSLFVPAYHGVIIRTPNSLIVYIYAAYYDKTQWDCRLLTRRANTSDIVQLI